MRTVLQRVSRAEVRISTPGGQQTPVGRIGRGLVVLLGIRTGDTKEDAAWLVDKIVGLRVFSDPEGPDGLSPGNINRSLGEVSGGLLIVSQFTLYGDCRKGRRPSFTDAMAPRDAEGLYDHFVDLCKQQVAQVETGRFGAMMEVDLVNDGPVTLLVDSPVRSS